MTIKRMDMKGKLACAVTAAWVMTASFICQGAFSAPAVQTIETVENCEAIPVEVVKRIDLPRGYHEGLFYDGKNIWVINGKKGKIWVMDTSTGSVAADIEPIADFTEGISLMPDGSYYVTDWDAKKLYRARLKDNKLVAESEIDLAPSYPAGVIWNGSELYVITWTRGMGGTKYHLLRFDGKGKLLDKIRIKNIEEPAHLAWDGKDLWITSWYSKQVYKVDLKRMKSVGVFTSPVSDATGIVWDGEYLWLTGTDGDLYRLKVGKDQKERNIVTDYSNIILETNQGKIEIKLMPKVAPKACENFVKLVESGYYNGIIFHRVIKDFMIQGGDPTGTGMGGNSVWGGTFEDEVSPDVTFNKTGLIAMANSGPKSNGSQFFITTVATPWLNMQHTIFGEVVSGYDVVKKIESVKTGANDKPATEQKIIKAYLK